MRTQPSFCRFCHNGCPILVDIEGGRAIRVRGDQDNPVYVGYTCVKGRALPEEHYHRDRLLFSQRRVAPGTFESIGSEQVMDEVAAGLQRIIDAYGPNAIAVYSGTKAFGNPTTGALVQSVADAIGSSMRFTSDSLDQPGKHVAKGLHGMWMAGPQGFNDPDVGVIIGANPLISYAGGLPMGSPGEWLRRWSDNGFQLIVIDPRRTELARRAVIHLQPRPGQDVAILAGMIRVILSEQLQDKDFLESEVSGVEQLRAAVDRFTVDAVAARADISGDDLVRAARTFAAARRGYAVAGTGPNMSGPGTLFEYLVLALNTICGRWLRAGDRVGTPFTLTPEIMPVKAQAVGPFPAYDVGEPLAATGLRPSLGGLPTGAVPDEILGGEIRALISVGGNPVAAWPDQLKTINAMQALELLVQVDVRMSATARYADYIIAPKMSLEMPSTTGLHELVYLYGASYGGFPQPWAQWTDAVVDPPEGSDLIAEWEFFYGLGQRMGLALELGPPFEFLALPKVALDMARKPTTEELLHLLAQGSRVPLEEVRSHPRGGLFPEPAVVVAPKDADCTARLDVGNPQLMTDLAAAGKTLGNRDAERPGTEPLPFRLISRRMQQSYNSSVHDIKAVRNRPYNPAFMNPDDLTELGLCDGDHVDIRSHHSAIPAIVKGDPSLRRGLVSMTHAFGDAPEHDLDFGRIGSTTGRLLDTGVFQPYTGQPLMSNIPVEVQPRRTGQDEMRTPVNSCDPPGPQPSGRRPELGEVESDL